ncbi:MAG: cupin domain-containing protein, partial [Planctomycetota bacterium]
ESNCLVISGELTYLTGQAAPQILKGGWAVARPKEMHGYRNSADAPLHLLLLTLKAPPDLKSDDTEIRQRVFRQPSVNDKNVRVYQTGISRGLQMTFSPGSTQKVDYARVSCIFVLEGRVMTLMAGEKVSLDPGEGVFVQKSVVEVVGVAGHSIIAVYMSRI